MPKNSYPQFAEELQKEVKMIRKSTACTCHIKTSEEKIERLPMIKLDKYRYLRSSRSTKWDIEASMRIPPDTTAKTKAKTYMLNMNKAIGYDVHLP